MLDVGARAEELAHLDRQPLEPRGEPVGPLGATTVVAGEARLAVRTTGPLDQLVAAVDARDERR